MRTVRLTEDHREQSARLGREAFGPPPPGGGDGADDAPPDPGHPRPGKPAWGLLDDAGRLVAQAVGREDASWWHGHELPTCGVADVTVEAESRGRGLLPGLLRTVLDAATERGAAVSTLFPTAPGIYRGLGYEVVSSLDHVELPTAALAAVRPPAHTATRRGDVAPGSADAEAVHACYSRWAATHLGPLTRTGACFPSDGWRRLSASAAVTLAEDDDGVAGYATWRRGPGYGQGSVLEVDDLVALRPDALRALARVLGSFAGVCGTTRLRTSADHPLRFVLPSGGWPVAARYPLMLRVHDVPAALGAVAVADVAADLAFRVVGDGAGTLDGCYRVQAEPGRTTCARTEAQEDLPTLTPQGLALAYAGARPAGALRLSGHLTGGDPTVAADFDAGLDRLLRGRTPAILDYF